MTLEEYLQKNMQKHVVDHAVRAYIDSDGQLSFYIHPFNVDGETLYFAVEENDIDLIATGRQPPSEIDAK